VRGTEGAERCAREHAHTHTYIHTYDTLTSLCVIPVKQVPYKSTHSFSHMNAHAASYGYNVGRTCKCRANIGRAFACIEQLLICSQLQVQEVT
jgi:hypothetical protein